MRKSIINPIKKKEKRKKKAKENEVTRSIGCTAIFKLLSASLLCIFNIKAIPTYLRIRYLFLRFS